MAKTLDTHEIKAVQEWLDRHELILNPFGPGIPELDPLLLDTWQNPYGWEDIGIPNATLLLHSNPKDGRIAAFYLGYESFLRLNKAFPVWFFLSRRDRSSSLIVSIAKAAARSWLDLLPLNPEAALDLVFSDRRALAEFLVWSFGTSSVLRTWLLRNGLQENVSGRALIRELERAEMAWQPAGIVPTRSRTLLFELERNERTFALHGMPPEIMLLSWLNLRPPDVASTYLLIVEEEPGEILPFLHSEFMIFIPSLLSHSILPKIFASEVSLATDQLRTVKLFWRNETLNSILQNRFTRSGGKSFDALFGPYPPKVLQQLEFQFIAGAQGSLMGMLDLGNRLIKTHCEKYASEIYLTPDELDDVLKHE